LKCAPGHVRHVNCTMPADAAVSPSQLAQDFTHFAAVLKQHSQGGVRVIGPDVAGSLDTYAKPFVQAKPPIDVFTWHFYYGPGSSRPHGLKAAEFYKPTTLDRFLHGALDAAGLLPPTQAPELWVGETSSTYGERGDFVFLCGCFHWDSPM
jgi:hypothetical protein